MGIDVTLYKRATEIVHVTKVRDEDVKWFLENNAKLSMEDIGGDFAVYADVGEKSKALRLANALEKMSLSTKWNKQAAKELRRLHELNQELLEALQRVMDIDTPLTGNPTHAQLVEHWEYEKSQGRGEADDRLFALAVIIKASGETS